ncbi:MAG: hypothetical protein COC06_08095 [Bacteroidales bacterium]|nr:MAG: hypothetical protein COC06_08095 [Bacteroidales bacterium]
MKTKQFRILKVSSLFLFMLIATQSCMVSSLHPLYTNKDRVHKEELCGKWQNDEQSIFEITTMVDSSKLIFNQKYPFDSDLGSKEDEKQTFYEHFMTSIDSSKSISRKRNNFLISSAADKGKQDKDETEKIKNDLKEKISNLKESEYKQVSNLYYQIKITDKDDAVTVFNGRLSKLDKYYFLDIIPDDDALEKKLNDDYLIGLVAPMHGFFKLQFMGEKLKFNWIEPHDFKELRREKKVRLKSIQQNDREIITAKTSDIQKFLIKFADTELFNNEDSELILTPVK